MCIYRHEYLCVIIYMYEFLGMYACICMYVRIIFMYVCMCVCTHICIYVYVGMA